MLPVDSYVRKRAGDGQHRSEAARRLYWSTYQKMADQAPAPRWKSLAWMGVRRLLGVLRRWWPESVPAVIRVSEEGLPTHQFISEERQV